jgi:thiol:disulfide interchange protein
VLFAQQKVQLSLKKCVSVRQFNGHKSEWHEGCSLVNFSQSSQPEMTNVLFIVNLFRTLFRTPLRFRASLRLLTNEGFCTNEEFFTNIKLLPTIKVSVAVRRFLCTSIIATAAISFAAQAQEEAATEHVTARLIAETNTVYPGAELYLGVQQIIIPHWHTYWSNPGDSGNATTIDWQLPAGASASDILWPAPSRISMGPITNYGYENEVTLLSRIRVPENLNPGETFSVRAEVDWLVCEEECIPQQVTLSLVLPVVSKSESTEERHPLIAAALARLPVESPWSVQAFAAAEGQLRLVVEASAGAFANVTDAWFYPYEWGVIRQSDTQILHLSSDALELHLPEGEVSPGVGAELAGVLVLTDEEGDQHSFTVVAPVKNAVAGHKSGVTGLAAALLLALAGGLVLNLMPCVFPVLSLKALALIGQSGQSQASIRRHGLTYTFGILTSFALLALVLVALKAGGAQIGWGFQFQSPLFVLLVAYLMFAVGLSLSGVFYVGGSVTGVGSGLAAKSGYSGSFFTGVLATIVATPCTAPFMAAALGYALTQPPAQLLLIFLSLGLGLALPYLALSWWPALQRWLPRPGAWMEHLKQAMAFPMYAAAVWLVWVLARQSGADAAALALGGMVLIAFSAWLYTITRGAGGATAILGSLVAGLALLLALGGGYSASQKRAEQSTESQIAHNWQTFSNASLHKLREEGRPVFLNFTAAWCISCLVNERVALSHERVVAAFSTDDITYLKGDWTNRDPEITAFLADFGRSGVPLYLFYPAGRPSDPVQLPQILTPDIVLSVVRANRHQASLVDPTSLSLTF